MPPATNETHHRLARKPQSRFDLEACESRQLLSADTHVALPNLLITPSRGLSTTVQGYTPAQIKNAYGFSSLKGDGAGQTIAIVDAFSDPTIAADLVVFNRQFGLPTANLQVVSQTGGSVKNVEADAGWASEIALDVQWAHAIAAGAKILLVETNSDAEADLMAGVNYARNVAGVSVISLSWGESEYRGETSYDSYFTTPSGHTCVTFVAASGDEGAATGPEFPASSPNVLSVGGTTLNLTSSGAISSETGWRDSSGGSSTIEKSPKYQSSITGSTSRQTPDVSYNADPNTGFAVYNSYKDGGGWSVVGGTSAGAPQWAALIAIANQTRVAAGLGTLDGASQTLPTLYSLYASPSSASYSTYTANFNDISSGGGSTRGGFGRGFGWGGGRGGTPMTVGGAAAGYDITTGLGSPKAAAVVQALANAAKAASVKRTGKTSTSTTTTSKTASRSNQTTTDVAAKATAALAIDVEVLPFAAETVNPANYMLAATTTASGRGATIFAYSASLAVTSLAAEPVLQRLNMAIAGDVLQTITLGKVNGSIATSNIIGVGANAVQVVQAATTVANLHFPHFDPAVIFDDAMGAFAMESTAMTLATHTDARTIAWAVTVAVIAVDAALIGRWIARKRPAVQRQQTQHRAMHALQPIEN